jgi:UDP-N-acetylglucosamine 2-epimerase (non-hydrolysing)
MSRRGCGPTTHDCRGPKRGYRTAIDAGAQLLFAPTETAARNLRAEGVSGDVHITGNPGIDALLAAKAALPARPLHDGSVPRLLVTCHRRESWGEGLAGIAAALRKLASSAAVRVDMLLHPNPHVAASMRRMLNGTYNLNLLEPCGHAELVLRMRDADLILSDSGGIQEEAPALGTPLLVLRDKTERPEAIATGNARLVGTDSARIVAEVRRLLGDPVARAAMSRPSLPFGDGSAAPRIASIVEDWLSTQSVVAPPRSAAASY